MAACTPHPAQMCHRDGVTPSQRDAISHTLALIFEARRFQISVG